MTTRSYESLAQASERTGLSIKTLRRRIATGDLPAYRNARAFSASTLRMSID